MSLDDLIESSKKRPPSQSRAARPPSPPPPSSPPRWYQVWIQAITRPSVETYERFLRDPKCTVATAYIWMSIAAGISSGAVLVTSITQIAGEASRSLPVTVLVLAFSFLLLVIIKLLSYSAGVGVTHVVARAFGGTGTFAQLAYVTAAYSTPLTIIGSIAGVVVKLLQGSIPMDLECLFSIVLLPLPFYYFHLALTGIRAAHKLTPASALAGALVSGGVIFICGEMGPSLVALLVSP